MKIILDTNFLMAVAQFKIDVFAQLRGHELCTANTVILELKKQAEGASKDSRAARLALELVRTKRLKILKSKEKNTDRSLLAYSKMGYAIATQDRALRERIESAGGRQIYIRQKRYVII